jgi:hypothetical protein
MATVAECCAATVAREECAAGIRELANAVTAMHRIAPKAVILATRGIWEKGEPTGDDLSCLFATWKTGNQETAA